MTKQQQKLDFVAAFVQEYAGTHGREACVQAAGQLLRLAKRYHALAVAYCNGCPEAQRAAYPRAGVLIEDWTLRIHRRKDRLQEKIRAACAPFELPYGTGLDSRGCAVKVRFPSGTGNMWGAKDWYAVPA